MYHISRCIYIYVYTDVYTYIYIYIRLGRLTLIEDPCHLVRSIIHQIYRYHEHIAFVNIFMNILMIHISMIYLYIIFMIHIFMNMCKYIHEYIHNTYIYTHDTYIHDIFYIIFMIHIVMNICKPPKNGLIAQWSATNGRVSTF